MPLSRHRKLKPEAMPAFTMLSEAFLTKNTTTATSAIVASTCQKMSRTLRSRRKARALVLKGTAGLQARSNHDAGLEARDPGSLERRREQETALGPQRIGTALQFQRRAHADGALVALAVVADLLHEIKSPVVGETHH